MMPSKENKTIAEMALGIFGGEPSVIRGADEKGTSNIDILSCKDRPCKWVTSYSTLGLSDYSIGLKVDGVPLRVELVGACATQYDQFVNILGTCAFNIINSNFRCKPGIIYPNVVGMYLENQPMKHVLFTTAFVWEKKCETLEFKPMKIVTWLLIVPISDLENKYAEEHGSDSLEAVFEQKHIDIFDLKRASAL